MKACKSINVFLSTKEAAEKVANYLVDEDIAIRTDITACTSYGSDKRHRVDWRLVIIVNADSLDKVIFTLQAYNIPELLVSDVDYFVK